MDQTTNLAPEVSVDANLGNVSMVDGQDIVSPLISPSTLRGRSTQIEGSDFAVAKQLFERWTQISTVTVSSGDGVNKELVKFGFPSSLVTGDYAEASNSYSILRNYAYLRADVEVKFMVNANKFQVGQVQASAYYAESRDAYIALRNNVYSRSQMMHQLISLHNNQSVLMHLNYAYPKQYVRIRGSEGFPAEDFASVKLLVLNQLRIPSGTSHSCQISVYARLCNVQLTGMVPNQLQIASPEMFSALSTVADLIKVGEKAVNIISGKNRDLPRDPRPDSVVIPRQCSSWAIGRNLLSPANVLRLDSKGICPETSIDEMQVPFIASQYGLLSQANWSFSNQQNHVIWSDYVTPIGSSVHKLKEAEWSTLAIYQPTPVGVLASSFAYWRGSLKYKFDFIASFMHTGRVVATFYPACVDKTRLKAAHRTNLTQVIFDLQETQSFTFEIPFLWDKEWCSTHSLDRNNSDSFPKGIGRVDLSVVNALIPNDSISPTIDINIYLSGGEDFEVAIPVNPEVGLSWDPIYKIKQTISVKIRPGYTLCGLGSWRFFEGGYCPVIRYGNMSDQVSYVDNLEYKTVYMFEDGSTFKHKDGTVPHIYSYFVSPPNIYKNPLVLAAFVSLEDAKNFIISGTIAKWTTDYDVQQFKECRDKSFKIVWKSTHLESFLTSSIEHEMDNVVSNPVGTLAPLSNKAFGESFADLKDLIRRYQYYSDYAKTLTSDNHYGSTLFRIPLTFSGLKIDPSKYDPIDEITNRMRNGIIPVIASAYRFFSGSMKVRIIVTSDDPNLFLNVSHVPELTTGDYSIQNPGYTQNKDFIVTGYAGYGQSVRMNQLIDLEVPYYLPGVCGFLQRTDLSREDDMKIFSLMGCLEVSCMTPILKETKLDFRIFFAAADDTRFMNFTGFPPMIFPKQVPVVPLNKVKTKMSALKLSLDNSRISYSSNSYIDTLVKNSKRINSPYKYISGEDIFYYVPATKHHSASFVVSSPQFSNTYTFSKNPVKYIVSGSHKYYGDATVKKTIVSLGLTTRAGVVKIGTAKLGLFLNHAEMLHYLLSAGMDFDLTEIVEWIVKTSIKTQEEQGVDMDFSNIIEVHPKPQIQHESGEVVLTPKLKKALKDLGFNFDNVDIIEHEAFWNDFFGVQAAGQNIAESIKESATNAMNMATEGTTRAIRNFTELGSNFCNAAFRGMSRVLSLSKALLFELLHVICNPSITTLTLSLASFFTTLIFPWESARFSAASIGEAISGFLRWYRVGTQANFFVRLLRFNFEQGMHEMVNRAEEMRDERVTHNYRRYHEIVVMEGARGAWTYRFPNRNYQGDENYPADDREQLSIDPSPIEHESGDDSPVAVIFSTMVTSACLMLGIKESFSMPGGIFKFLLKDLPKAAIQSSHLTILFRNIITTFNHVYNWIYNKFFPEAKLYKDLFESEALSEWAENSQYLTDPLYEARVANSPKLIMEVHAHQKLGMAYNKACVEGKLPKEATHIVSKITSQLTTVADTFVKRGLISSCRFEPFVLHVTGEPGIGKSRLITTLAHDMLKAVGIKVSNPIYVKNAGNAYWNGLGTQPVVLYDDFMACANMENTESLELMQLKSSANFNPPCAAVSEKNKWYNPTIVILSSNNAYPKDTRIAEEKALWRRRDFLVEAKLKKEYIKGDSKPISAIVKKLPVELLRSVGHLDFSRYIDPTKPGSQMVGFSDFENFKSSLIEEFSAFYERELANYRQAISDSMEIMDSPEGVDLSEFKKEIGDTSVSKFIGLADSGHQLFRNMMNASHEADDDQDHCVVNIGPSEAWGESITDLKDKESVDFNLDELSNTLNETAQEYHDWVMNMPSTSQESDDIEYTARKMRGNYDGNPKVALANAKLLSYQHKRSSITCKHNMIFDPELEYMRCNDENYGTFSVVDENFDSVIVSEEPCTDDSTCPMLLVHRDLAMLILRPYIIRMFKQEHKRSPNFIPRCFDPTVKYERLTKKIKTLKQKIAGFRENLPTLQAWETLKKTSAFQYLSNVKNIMKAVAVIAAAGATIFAGITAFKSLIGNTDPEVVDIEDPESCSSQPSEFGKKMRKDKKKSSTVKSSFGGLNFAEPESEGSMAQKHVLDRLKRNSGFMSFIKLKNFSNHRVKFLGICGNFAFTVKHFYEEWKAAGRPPMAVTLNCTGAPHNVKLADSDFTVATDSSVCVLKFPRDMPSFCDIRKHIATIEDHQYVTTNTMLYNFEYDKTIEIAQLRCSFNHYAIEIGPTSDAAPQRLVATYNYPRNAKGLCGAVLVSAGSTPKIIGMHVAGNTEKNTGYSQPLIRESVQDLNCRISVTEVPRNGPGSIEPEMEVNKPMLKNLDKLELQIHGTLDRDIVPHMPEKTRLEKLPTYGAFREPTHEPAILSPRDPRMLSAGIHWSPLEEGVKKHAMPPIPFKRSDVEEAATDVLEKLCAICPPVLADRSNELLTDQQIVGGIPGVPGYKGMELSSSEGYPLQLQRPPGVANKRWLIDVEESPQGNILKGFHPLLQETRQHHKQQRIAGIASNTIFVDSLKDFLVSKEKLLKPGSTRVFSASPIEYTMAIREYFGHFQAAINKHRIKNEVSVGLTANGPEWGELVRYLSEVSPGTMKIVTGDYSHYGDSLQSDCLYHVFKIMMGWYDYYYSHDKNHEENQKVRQVLCEEFLHVQHLAGNVVYKMYCGIPSGFALTVEMNSLVNMMYMRIAWRNIFTANADKRSLAQFNKNVRLLTYGDDLIMSVSDDAIEHFNFNSLSEFLASYNIAFTHSSKEVGHNKPYEPYTESTFLKRGFVPHPTLRGEFLAPLPESSILNQLDYAWKNNDMHSLVHSNMRSSLNEAYSRGPEYFNKLRKQFLQWTSIHTEQHTRLDTWDDIDRRNFADYYGSCS